MLQRKGFSLFEGEGGFGRISLYLKEKVDSGAFMEQRFVKF